MEIFILICTLFIIGSVFGWVLEVFFRRIFSAKKWINPGFMIGPYLPLYGFGVIVLYLVMQIPLQTGAVAWDYVIKILIIGVMMTLIELIAGLIFIKGLNLKLWDYSNRWGNFKGIICPLFSFLWLVVGVIYAFFINPLLVSGLTWLGNNIIYSFFIGIFIGMVIVDFCYSLHLGVRIKKVSNGMVVKYDAFKGYLEEKHNKKSFAFFVGKIFPDKNTLREDVNKFKQKVEEKFKFKKEQKQKDNKQE